MEIQIKMGDNYKQLLKNLGSAAANLSAAVDKGLELGAIDTAAYIAQTKLTGQQLKVRSGNLRRQINGGLKSSGVAWVGIKDNSPVDDYSYLLIDTIMQIFPKKAKRLAIPLPAALTPSGKPRYPEGPRSVDGLFYMKTKSGTELLVREKGYGKKVKDTSKTGKKKRKTKRKLEFLFVLKKMVYVSGTGALPDGVIERVPNMTEAIQKQLDILVAKEEYIVSKMSQING